MEIKTASVISTGLHAAVLLWALVSFSGKSFEVTPAESLPVDLVSEKAFSEMTKGVKDAPKAATPKPLVEKIAEPKPEEKPAPKVVEKKEVKATAQKAPEPEPAPTPDPIAEKIKKPDEKKQEAKSEPKPLPPKKPEPKQPKFDADKIAALLDKRDPTRTAATGDAINDKPTLGHVKGAAATLSQSEIDAFRKRISACWAPPVGLDSAQELVVVFRRAPTSSAAARARWGRHSPKAPSGRFCSASPTRCCAKKLSKRGKTWSSPSSRATCSSRNFPTWKSKSPSCFTLR
jgi:outer membrane biosynthesis protein TonB